MLGIVVVGDSVIWGQGLEEKDKFTNLLVKNLHVPARILRNESHSGAEIGFGNSIEQGIGGQRDSHPSQWKDSPFWGEIPASKKTIVQQIGDAHSNLAVNGEKVDIVIMNGAANDAGFMDNLELDGPEWENDLRKAISHHFTRIRNSIGAARGAFGDALILYTGYYNGLSFKSQIPKKWENEIDSLLVTAAAAINGGVGLILGPVVGIASGIVAFLIGKDVVEDNIKRIKAQSEVFHHVLLNEINRQLFKFNNDERFRGNVFFVNSGFGRHNAMWTKNSFVHDLENSFSRRIAVGRATLNYTKRKEVRDKYSSLGDYLRIIQDDKFLTETALSDIKFHDDLANIEPWRVANAHFAHPNKKGAVQYAKNLKAVLERQLKFKLRKELTLIDDDLKSLRNTYSSRLKIERENLSLRMLSTLNIGQVLSFRIENFSFEVKKGFVDREKLPRLNVFGNHKFEQLWGRSLVRVLLDYGKGAVSLWPKTSFNMDFNDNADNSVKVDGFHGISDLLGNIPLAEMKDYKMMLSISWSEAHGLNIPFNALLSNHFKLKGNLILEINGNPILRKNLNISEWVNDTARNWFITDFSIV